MENISRRDFLKFCITSAVLPWLPELRANLNASEMRQKLADAAFIKNFLINQSNPNQYTNEPKLLRTNACGPAVIAEVLNIYSSFANGSNPKVTIHDIITNLSGKTYDTFAGPKKFLEWNGSMFTSSVKAAMDLLCPAKTVEIPGFEVQGYGKDQFRATERTIVPTSKIPELLQLAEEQVFSRGGMLITFLYNYNGHFSILSQMGNYPNALIVDSRDNSAGYRSIFDYVKNTPDGREGILSAFGVVPM